MMRALDAEDTAAAIGRSRDWLLRNHESLTRESGFPPPIMEAGARTWDAAQVYAWIDRKRPLRERAFIAAFRAAFRAAAAELDGEADTIRDDRAALDARFGIAPPRERTDA